MIDLETKVEKYESKTVDCKELARLATDRHQRNLYEELAGYYGQVAADFRHVIAKRGNGRPSIYPERE
jgi:hypothetical protein